MCNYKCESVGGGEGTYLEFEVPKGHAGHVNQVGFDDAGGKGKRERERNKLTLLVSQALKDMYPMVELWVSCPDV